MAALPVAGPASAAPCAAATTLNTFKVKTEWNKPVYKPGEVVKVTVTVTRPGSEDPLGNGIPMDGPVAIPAEDVLVSTSFVVNPPYYPYAGGTTDANGQVGLKIKLPKKVKGPVDVMTYARVIHNQSGPACTEVTEQGFHPEYGIFRVK